MSSHDLSHAIVVVVSTTFVSLLAMPVIGPALPVVQTALGINNRDIGWIVMSSYTLPGRFLCRLQVTWQTGLVRK